MPNSRSENVDSLLPSTETVPRGVPRRWLPVTALLVATWWVVCVSTLVLPPSRSRDGRLLPRPLDGDVVSSNSARLDLDPGVEWGRIRLAIDVRPRETVDVLLDRSGDRFHALRLSGAVELRSALIDFQDGHVASSRVLSSVPFPLEERVVLELARGADGIGAALIRDPGGPMPLVDVPSTEPGDLEISMFPPWSPRLFDRVRVLELRDREGRPIALRPHWLERALRSLPVSLVLAFAAALLATRGRRPFLRRLVPHYAATKPVQLVRFFALATVLIAALAWFASTTHFLAPTDGHRRGVYRVAFTALPLLVAGVMVVHDRLVGWFPRLRSGLLMTGPGLALGGFTGTLALFLAVHSFFDSEPKANPTEPAVQHAAAPAPEPAGIPDERRADVVCFGGSSTLGGLFPPEWPHNYPRQLQEIMRRRGGEPVVVNLGLGGGGMVHIMKRMADDLEHLRPHTLVLMSLANNTGSISVEEFEALLNEFVDVAQPTVERILFVEEPSFGQTYSRSDYGLEYCQAIERVAVERGIGYLSPRATFQTHRDGFLFIDGGRHLTKYGYGLLAGLVDEALAELPVPEASP